ncbi:MAG: DNA gyrase subunit A, partial [Selenomonadaceae bacterium]|nr:DNA gyrase subunit A [Selenomonadaceae bacterium]
RDATPQIILNQLFKHTQMQDTFGVNMIALVDGKPQLLNLKEILKHYIRHQEEVITRRTRFDLAKARARAHILEGLTTAVKSLERVIKIVRDSSSVADAKSELMSWFEFSDVQAQAILDLRLQKLTGLERSKLDEEYRNVIAAIKNYELILGDEQRILQIIKDELTAVKEKFNDDRRTEIVGEELQAFEAEDLIDDDDIVVTLTHGGYVKRIDLDAYKRQKRGGVGVTGMGTKEEDFVEQILITTTHHTILFFTNKGKVFHLKAYQIAESGRAAKGNHISNLLMIEAGEKITAMIKVKNFDPTRYLFMATRKGIVKKTQLSEFSSMMKRGMIAIKLDKDDELIGVKFTEGERFIILGTAQGMTISFAEEEVRSMGRSARGVKGIQLKRGDRVIGMDKLRRGAEVLTVSEEGIGKRTPAEEYRPQGRGGKGLINMKITEKTGEVVGIKVVTPDQELLLITTEGFVIRTSIDDIGLQGRNTQGVILMKTKEDDRVASLATVTLRND